MEEQTGAPTRSKRRLLWMRGHSLFATIAMLAASLTGIATTALIAASPASAGTPPAPPSGWTTVFSDGFNGAAGTAPSQSNWFYDIGTGYGTGEIEHTTNTTNNVYLDGNGNMVIKAIDNNGTWTSGRLESTRDDFYAPPGGQMEMEASIEQPNPPNGLGYWPAFWALGSPMRAGGGWPTAGELDMMEDVNASNEASQTLHDASNSPGHPLIACPTTGCQTGFNTYAVLINRVNTSAEYLQFIMDGVVEQTITEASVGATAWQEAIDHGEFIIWDLAMGGNYPDGVCNCTAPSTSTSSGYSMLVNWVAVYEQGATSGQSCGQGCVAPATPTAAGEVTGLNGLCLSNENDLDTEGNPIGLAGCSGSPGEEWNVENNGTLQSQGGCLDAVSAGTTSGTNVDWYACNGTAAQGWSYQSNKELINTNSGLCLTDPSGNTASQLQIQTCTDATDQQWTLPTGGGGTTTTTSTPSTTAASTTTTTTPVTGGNCSASVSGTALSRTGWTASTNTAAAGADAVSNAIDGNLSTRFSSDAYQAPGQSLEINLGSAQSFNELEMAVPNSAGDYAVGYNVEVSNNGSSWTTVATCSGTGTPEIVSFPTQTAQYVQVVLTASSTTSWWSVDELYLYGSGGGGGSSSCSASTSGQTQLSQGGWTASTNAPSGTNDAPANGIDGNLSTRYSSDEYQASGIYYEVNLGSAKTFDELEMAVPNSSGDYARGYTVAVSPNGTSWTTLATCTGTATPEIVSFPAQTAQYVKVTLNTASTTSWWSIDELDLFAAGGGGTTTTTTSTTSTTVPVTASCSAPLSGSALSRSGWSASSNTNSAAADAPANAIDGNAGTRFSSDADQAAGQTLTINLGATESFHEIDLDSADWPGDYARGFNVQVSSNGTSWTTVASCTGSATPEVVSFASQSAHYVQVVLTAAATSNWWSVGELNLY
jgi:hypothetical protein